MNEPAANSIQLDHTLSLGEFVQLLQKLPPSQIAKLPLDKLPPNLPSDISEKVPKASRAALEDLLMNINAIALKKRMQDRDRYGEDVLNAFDKARMTRDSASIRVFKNKILNLIDLLQQAKAQNKIISNDTLVKLIISINNLLIDVRTEQSQMETALRNLQSATPANEKDKEQFSNAINILSRSIKETEKILSEFYILRLKILSRSIMQKRKLIEAREETGLAMREELLELRSILERNNTVWNRTFKRKSTLSENDETQKRIQHLIGKIRDNEVVISENDLILWLDTIVEASLNKESKERVAKSLRTARISLYYLLSKFCQGQEESAIQIAQNPFIQVEPEKAIRFVLMSEQFILDYFAKKRNETTAWLSGAAENKIQELDKLQKEILSELKKTSKSFR